MWGALVLEKNMEKSYILVGSMKSKDSERNSLVGPDCYHYAPKVQKYILNLHTSAPQTEALLASAVA